MGLSPFEVLHKDLNEVFELYVLCAIKESKAKKSTNNNKGDTWVTSKTANWH